MGASTSKNKFFKKLLIALLIIVGIGGITYILLPEETKNNLNNQIGLELTPSSYTNNQEETVVVRKITSRKSLFGDKWVISGKIFNLSDSLTVNHVKLMFNFSDGVETVAYDYKISPQSTFGKKFKEKIEGHGEAEFNGIDVMEVGTE